MLVLQFIEMEKISEEGRGQDGVAIVNVTHTRQGQGINVTDPSVVKICF